MAITRFQQFKQIHEILLLSSGLPPHLYEKLYEKLSGNIFDSGNIFAIEEVETEEGGRERRLVVTANRVEKESDVFLVDHSWSFRLPDARKQLEEIPGLAERVAAMLCISSPDTDKLEADELEADKREEIGDEPVGSEKVESILSEIRTKAAEENSGAVQWLELDERGMSDSLLEKLDLSTAFPELVGLSLWGNKISSVESVREGVRGLKNLRALWLNENPVEKNYGKELKRVVLEVLPKLELFNSKYTESYGIWAVGFSAGIYGSHAPGFTETETRHPLRKTLHLDLSDREITILKPEVFNPLELPLLSFLDIRGNEIEGENTDEIVNTLRLLPSLISLKVDIPGPLGRTPREVVEKLPSLVSLNGAPTWKVLEGEEDKIIVEGGLKPYFFPFRKTDSVVDRVLCAMWRKVQVYRLATDEKLDETPVWYLMDEVGSSLRHSDEPSFALSPFLYLPDGTMASAISYTLMWPIKDLGEKDECTRDYLSGIGEDKQRSARLTAWFSTPKSYFQKAFEEHWKKIGNGKISERDEEVFFSSPLPEQNKISLLEKEVLKVFSDLPPIHEFLTRPDFTMVEEPSDADIIFTSVQIDDEFRKTAKLRAPVAVNQFPFESSFVMKHHLAHTVHTAYGRPTWFQTTYNLETELAPLIGEFQNQENDNDSNNLWIVKPWNMARSLDTNVVHNLPQIIRLMETGPKIAQKYITKPSLFKGKKFDLRFLVLVKNFKPLDAYLHHVFWARIANKEYNLEEKSLPDFETHFTVMNYVGKVTHVATHDFVREFEEEHGVSWNDIESRVRSMLKKVFCGAAFLHPQLQTQTETETERRIEMSRAIYGVDIMLDSDMMPKLLEVTYCPDCGRATKYDMRVVSGPDSGKWVYGKDFYNSVFGCLFRNETENVSRL